MTNMQETTTWCTVSSMDALFCSEFPSECEKNNKTQRCRLLALCTAMPEKHILLSIPFCHMVRIHRGATPKTTVGHQFRLIRNQSIAQWLPASQKYERSQIPKNTELRYQHFQLGERRKRPVDCCPVITLSSISKTSNRRNTQKCSQYCSSKNSKQKGRSVFSCSYQLLESRSVQADVREPGDVPSDCVALEDAPLVSFEDGHLRATSTAASSIMHPADSLDIVGWSKIKATQQPLPPERCGKTPQFAGHMQRRTGASGLLHSADLTNRSGWPIQKIPYPAIHSAISTSDAPRWRQHQRGISRQDIFPHKTPKRRSSGWKHPAASFPLGLAAQSSSCYFGPCHEDSFSGTLVSCCQHPFETLALRSWHPHTLQRSGPWTRSCYRGRCTAPWGSDLIWPVKHRSRKWVQQTNTTKASTGVAAETVSVVGQGGIYEEEEVSMRNFYSTFRWYSVTCSVNRHRILSQMAPVSNTTIWLPVGSGP